MSDLKVRLYNVQFGDAIFIIVPDKDEARNPLNRHILIDLGNAFKQNGGDDTLFEPIFDDIQQTLNGQPLDLYVMTHEHLDHVQGLLTVFRKNAAKKLHVRNVWLTASSAPDYYQRFPKARKQKDLALENYAQIKEYLAVLAQADEPFAAYLNNNDPRSTADCVGFLRELIPNPTYVFRGSDIAGQHPFKEASFEIWAPEEDTSDYFRSLQPIALGVTSTAPGVAGDPARLSEVLPPSGVDLGAFYNLVKSRIGGYVDNMLEIDRAANNTSVVFCLEWHGYRLLFSGDAEEKSWNKIYQHDQDIDLKLQDATLSAGDKAKLEAAKFLKPVHFLKISHHGSVNGRLPRKVLDKVLPSVAPDLKPRFAGVSTLVDVYNGVPLPDVTDELTARGVTVRSTQIAADIVAGQKYIEFVFSA